MGLVAARVVMHRTASSSVTDLLVGGGVAVMFRERGASGASNGLAARSREKRASGASRHDGRPRGDGEHHRGADSRASRPAVGVRGASGDDQEVGVAASRRNKRSNQVRPTANTGIRPRLQGVDDATTACAPQQAAERRHEGDRSQGGRPVRTVMLPATRAPGRQCTALERARRGTSTLPNHDTSALTKSPATLATGEV